MDVIRVLERVVDEHGLLGLLEQGEVGLLSAWQADG